MAQCEASQRKESRAPDTLSAGPSSAAVLQPSAQRLKLGWLRNIEGVFYSRTMLHHLITLSARANTLGGTVRLIRSAVLRLMIRSNFTGRSTGRSAGFTPLRILSTNVAARLYMSASLGP